jgi:hypothetical protein
LAAADYSACDAMAEKIRRLARNSKLGGDGGIIR